jgi:hypothetical protein
MLPRHHHQAYISIQKWNLGIRARLFGRGFDDSFGGWAIFLGEGEDDVAFAIGAPHLPDEDALVCGMDA